MSNSHLFKNFQKSKIKRPRDEIEPEDIILDAIAQRKEVDLNFSSQKIEVHLTQKIFLTLGMVFLIGISFLFFKSFQFQIVQGKSFLDQSCKNKFLLQELKTQRGIIYDRNFQQLVFNSQSFDLICNFQDLPKDDFSKQRIIKNIAGILNEPSEELTLKIEENNKKGLREFSISKNLDINKVIILKIRIDELNGFSLKQSKKRDYTQSSLFSHLLGYLSKDTQEGKAGLEKYYNKILEEKPGLLQTERDAQGRIIAQEIIKPPESGRNLILYLDSALQQKITEVLSATLLEYGVKNAAAIALDPKTGGVLALVSLPSFDNNIFSKTLSEEEFRGILENPEISFYNRAISGNYLIGSTIKPLIATATLQEKIIEPDYKINCQGGILLKDGTFKKDWKVHGWTDMRKAIAESCDVYFYTIGGGYGQIKGLGIEKIKKNLELFNLGEKTGIDLPEEESGFLPDPQWKENKLKELWYPGDTYNVSIGQGYLKVTPIQLTVAIGAFANGGKLMRPQIAKAAVDEKNNLIQEFQSETLKENFILPENLQVVREGMRQAVTSAQGTAYSLNFLPVSSAAKTGTAQTSREGFYHNWITVFAPYENPQIVLTIVIENVPTETGITNKIAKRVLEWYFQKEK